MYYNNNQEIFDGIEPDEDEEFEGNYDYCEQDFTQQNCQQQGGASSQQSCSQQQAPRQNVNSQKGDVSQQNPSLADLCQQANEKIKKESQAGGITDTEEDIKSAKSFINNIISKVKDGSFSEKFQATSDETGIPKKEIAKSFFTRMLGTIADVLGIALGTVENALTTLISILSYILTSGVHLICKVARNIVAIVTLNKTANA